MVHPTVHTFVNSVIALFLFLLGTACLFYPWASEMQSHLIEFLISSTRLIFLFGICFILLAIGIASNVWFRTKQSYYRMKVEPLPVTIDENVILGYLNAYWKQLFPESDIPCKITLNRNELYIEADLPFVGDAAKNDIIDRIEDDLKNIFLKTVGYKDPFYLTLSFQK